MNRRQFVKTTAAAVAVTASAGPKLLGTTRKAGDDNPVIGAGEHKYQCFHNWGELPKDYVWQTTHNVAIDSQGFVYITHQGVGKQMDTILVFDPSGKFVRSFGKEFHGGGHGIEFRKEGSEEFAYLSNTWNQWKLVKTTPSGELVWAQGRPRCKEYENPKANYNPTNVCFLPDGGFIVGDGYGSNYMLRFDKEARLVKVFGGSGRDKGKLATPHGQWLETRQSGDPVLGVCDRANHRLQTFTLDGVPIAATEPDKVVFFPAHARIRGGVLLLPDLHARVSLFDKEMKPLAQLGDDDAWRKKVVDSLGKGKGPAVRTQPKEWLPGKFVHPHDACFDKDGNIFVVEWVSTGRVTFLKKVS